MLDGKRPPPLYSRTVLTGVVVVVGVMTLALLGLTLTVFFENRYLGQLKDQLRTNNADRKADFASLKGEYQTTSQEEIREINRLRKLVVSLGGNPGPPRQFSATPTAPSGASGASSGTRSSSSSPQPRTTPSSTPSRRPSSRPSPTATPAPDPTPLVCVSPLLHRCIGTVAYHTTNPPAAKSRSSGILDITGPDSPVIDAGRITAVAFGAIYTGWSIGMWRRLDASCVEGRVMHVAFVVLWLPVWLTEAEQIHDRFLYWRLPLALVAIPTTVLAEHVHRRVHGHRVSSGAFHELRRTLSRSHIGRQG